MILDFSTSDIVLASTLRCLRYKMVRIEKVGKKGVFCFENVLETDVRDFEMFKIVVEPQEFNNAIKSLTTASKRIV